MQEFNPEQVYSVVIVIILYTVIIVYIISQQRTKTEEIKVRKNVICQRKKKSGCILNFKLPFLKLNTGNLDLPAQTLTG